MNFDDRGKVEMVVWNSRIADLPRGENRALLNRLYNGEPPFDPSKAEENNTEINRNFLHGTKILTDARRQWDSAFIRPGNYFNVALDSGPVHKRDEWAHTITRNVNKSLKRQPAMMQQVRATGASVMLHGLGPVMWKDRRSPIPVPLPISSLLIPSETEIDFTNLEWFAVFREWTPAQLYEMTHGPKVDPGWRMDEVKAQLRQVGEEYQKQPNATAYQYMPERIEEMIKQDMGFWQSDAVPTIDVWDFYFRQQDETEGWYRRIFPDWGAEAADMTPNSTPPSRKGNDKDYGFLYTSGQRKFAGALSEVLHVQFGDCSAVAPFRYHSVRSLGWMMWGICDLLNRLHCRFTESVFEQLLWIFRTSGPQDMDKIKKAMFTHMGVIPQDISFVPPGDRFKPDSEMMNQGFATLRGLLAENSSSYLQDFAKGSSGKEMTATETMALVNNSNALVSGMLGLAYEYQTPQYREICRRYCIKNSPFPEIQKFRLACLRDGVPPEMLDVDRWEVHPDQVIGAGNKTMAMAQVNALLAMRKNLGPDAQRRVDHMAIEVYTDDPALAETMAPIKGMEQPSKSVEHAESLTSRLMLGLEVKPTPKMVLEDYVLVWLKDMALEIKKIQAAGNVGNQDQVAGLANMGATINSFLKIMAGNRDEKRKVHQLEQALSGLMNFVKGFAQRLQEQQKKAQGANGLSPEVQGKIEAAKITAAAKAKNSTESHALKTAQRQAQFELEEQRKDREHQAEMRREHSTTMQEMGHNRIKSLFE